MPPALPDKRLFLAVWPDEAACAALHTVGRDWPWPAGAARYQPPDWHITLHFLGKVTPPQWCALLPALAHNFEPFEVTLQQPQAWPHGLVVLCPSVVPAGLLALQQHLGQVVQACGLAVDARPYRPHLTLARRAVLALPPQVAAVNWRVDSFSLVESTGDPQKRYRPLARYAATGGWHWLAPELAPEPGQ